MAFDPGPPPRRKDYVTDWGYWNAREDWKRKKDTWRAEQRHERETARAQQRQQSAGWTPRSSQPPDVGVIAGTDHVVSFKTKNDQDRTIIADGDYSDDRDGFNENHNDYGRKREGGGYFAEDRGYFTGPGR